MLIEYLSYNTYCFFEIMLDIYNKFIIILYVDRKINREYRLFVGIVSLILLLI